MEYLVLAILLSLSAFFSSSETALTAITKQQVYLLKKKNKRSGKFIESLRKDTSSMLTTILIGNNIVNVALASYATVMAVGIFRDMGVVSHGTITAITTVIVTICVLIIGEVTPQRVKIVRNATNIVEEELSNSGAFQYLAILHEDKVTGVREGKRDYGLQIEVRCWESKDAKIGSPTRLPYEVLERLAERITKEVPGVVSVTYNITKKPPSTIEAV